jgi:hypothetical protein
VPAGALILSEIAGKDGGRPTISTDTPVIKRASLQSKAWKDVERLLAEGGTPTPADLVKAVKRTIAIPERSRDHLLAYVKGSPRKRGRPKVPLGMSPNEHDRRKTYTGFFHPIRLIRQITMLSMEFSRYPKHRLPRDIEKALPRNVVLELKAAKTPEQKAIVIMAADRGVDRATIQRYYNKACKQNAWLMPFLNQDLDGAARD